MNHNHSCYAFANDSLGFSFLFLASSVYLGGVKPKLDINDVLGKATEASDSPHSSFLGERNSF